MDPVVHTRPVPDPQVPPPGPSAAGQAATNGPPKTVAAAQHWPDGSRDAAQALHQLLQIRDRQWHAFKGQPQRRAAEQLAAALVALLDSSNQPAQAVAGPARVTALALAEQGVAWLRGDLRDPGCPSHGH